MGRYDFRGRRFLRLKDVDGMTVWYGTYDPEKVNADKELEVKLYINGELFLHTDVVTLFLSYLGNSSLSLPKGERVKLFVGNKEVPFRLKEK